MRHAGNPNLCRTTAYERPTFGRVIAMSVHAQPLREDTKPFGRDLAGRAVVAGIIGGILIDLFLVVARRAPFPGIFQFVASAMVGKVAYTSSSYIWLGVAMHFVISIVWALLYAYAAHITQLRRRWLVGGFVFGIVVMIMMQAAQLLSHTSGPLTLVGTIFGLIAHVVFFGWPIAWILSRSGSVS